MGYPMSWRRLVNRNGFTGDYDPGGQEVTNTAIVAGDMRRLENDSRDDRHLRTYSMIAGITPEQVKTVFDAFFGDICGSPEWDETQPR